MNFIYFARCQEFVKIGRSANVNRRIQTLQTTMPFEIGPVWVMADPLKELERQCHLQFHHRRHRGEWFWWCADIEAFITNRIGKADDEQIELADQRTQETRLERCVRETRMRIQGFTTSEIVSSRRLFKLRKPPAERPSSGSGLAVRFEVL